MISFKIQATSESIPKTASIKHLQQQEQFLFVCKSYLACFPFYKAYLFGNTYYGGRFGFAPAVNAFVKKIPYVKIGCNKKELKALAQTSCF